MVFRLCFSMYLVFEADARFSMQGLRYYGLS